jgi:hypothetical protein
MQIDLCIEGGRVGMTMPQDLGYLCQGSTSTKQVRRECESKQVCTALRRADSGARQLAPDDT